MTSMNRALFGDHRDPAQELVEIFGSRAPERSPDPGAVDQAVSWGRGVLAEAGVPAENQVSAIAALRKAEPRLGLKSATYLAGLLQP